MSTQSPRRFSRDDFATGLIDTERATVLDLDRIDPAALPNLMDDILAGRKVWGPWRDSPLRVPAKGFLFLTAIVEVTLLPVVVGNVAGVMVDSGGPFDTLTVVALALAIAAIPVMLWLMLGAGGVTGADDAVSLSVTAAQGDDESIDYIRARWADIQEISGEDINRARILGVRMWRWNAASTWAL